ncbi:MAG: hypothetical protein KGL39_60015 [Patescibacteria group bacterium]|nr:hypothetical protein [Patescibacteria group bacterium]
MPTPQQRLDMAREFILCKSTLDECLHHEQIRFQLKAAGFELVKTGDKFFVKCGGDEYPASSVADLLQLIR